MLKLSEILDIKKLDVFFREQKVGTLALQKDYTAAFQYSKNWLSDGFSISPFSLPLTDEVFVPAYHPFDGLFGVFDDCLPDGWGRLLTDRLLKSKGIDTSQLSSLGRLALVQENAVGALCFKPHFESSDSFTKSDFDELAKECNQIFNDIEVDDYDEVFKAGGSSGGARPKVHVLIDEFPWIVKFGCSYDKPNIGKIEFECNELARKCGLDVPESKLIPSKTCSGFFASKRFDCFKNDAGTISKWHVVSAGGLLEASHRVPALDYDHLLKLTLKLTDDMSEVEKMFRLMVFNVKVGNKDDHAKNFSFVYDDKESQWRLSPAYDLTPNDGIAGEHTTTVNGKGKDITNDDLLAVAKRIGISSRKAKEIVERVEEVVYQLDDLISPDLITGITTLPASWNEEEDEGLYDHLVQTLKR